ncbi:MAG: OadG family transporter subunit [Thiohalocapsa sp.]
MNEMGLVMESLRLMGIGMGIVFGFLLLLVGVLRVMSWLALKIVPAEVPSPAAPVSSLTAPAAEADDLIAVISAAITRYRRRG